MSACSCMVRRMGPAEGGSSSAGAGVDQTKDEPWVEWSPRSEYLLGQMGEVVVYDANGAGLREGGSGDDSSAASGTGRHVSPCLPRCACFGCFHLPYNHENEACFLSRLQLRKAAGAICGVEDSARFVVLHHFPAAPGRALGRLCEGKCLVFHTGSFRHRRSLSHCRHSYHAFASLPLRQSGEEAVSQRTDEEESQEQWWCRK